MELKMTRPILRYHGGKWLIAPWIISHFSKHRTYTESMGGGASVLLRKQRSHGEVYNDKWGTVVNVFKVLRDPTAAEDLIRRIYLTPFSRDEFDLCNEANLSEIEDPIERARLTIFRSHAGFASASTDNKYATGFRKDAQKRGSTPSRDWMRYPDHIITFIERLRGVVIENKDYRDILQEHDGLESLHFIDPPYLHSTRNMRAGNAAYVMEFTDQDHIDMAELLYKLKGNCIVCGYESDLYNDLFDKRNWQKIRRKTYADGGGERVECLWIKNKGSNTLF